MQHLKKFGKKVKIFLSVRTVVNFTTNMCFLDFVLTKEAKIQIQFLRLFYIVAL